MLTPPAQPTPNCRRWILIRTNYGYPSRGKKRRRLKKKASHISRSILKRVLYINCVIFSIPEPTPSTMTALHQFGAEMLKLSRGLESFTPINEPKNVDITEPSKASDDDDDDVSNINNFESPAAAHIRHNTAKRCVHVTTTTRKSVICSR
jgi:hypothetical protein